MRRVATVDMAGRLALRMASAETTARPTLHIALAETTVRPTLHIALAETTVRPQARVANVETTDRTELPVASVGTMAPLGVRVAKADTTDRPGVRVASVETTARSGLNARIAGVVRGVRVVRVALDAQTTGRPADRSATRRPGPASFAVRVRVGQGGRRAVPVAGVGLRRRVDPGASEADRAHRGRTEPSKGWAGHPEASLSG